MCFIALTNVHNATDGLLMKHSHKKDKAPFHRSFPTSTRVIAHILPIKIW